MSTIFEGRHSRGDTPGAAAFTQLFAATPLRVAAICGFFVLALFALSWSCPGAETNASPSVAGKAEDANNQETLRAYLQLQEQLHATQLAIESSRQESDAAAARSAEAFTARLQAIEQSLNLQRARELEAMRSSNQVMLLVAGAFAAIGLLAMLITTLFQWRTVHRLAEISSALPALRSLGMGPPLAALGPGEMPLLTTGSVEQSNSRLLGAIDRLEHRIHELEHAAPSALNGGMSQTEKSNGLPVAPAPPSAGHGVEPDRPTVLLAKGQSLLNMDKAEEALACFDEILKTEPNHAEALVKKGTVLERLRKLNEALECYDRAIAADSSLTIAYLYKGGLFNRLERFAEALECYELALRAQEKPRSAAQPKP